MGHIAVAAQGEDVAIIRRLLPQIHPGAALVVVAQAPGAIAELVGEARHAYPEDVLPWSLMDHTPLSGMAFSASPGTGPLEGAWPGTMPLAFGPGVSTVPW